MSITRYLPIFFCWNTPVSTEIPAFFLFYVVCSDPCRCMKASIAEDLLLCRAFKACCCTLLSSPVSSNLWSSRAGFGSVAFVSSLSDFPFLSPISCCLVRHALLVGPHAACAPTSCISTRWPSSTTGTASTASERCWGRQDLSKSKRCCCYCFFLMLSSSLYDVANVLCRCFCFPFCCCHYAQVDANAPGEGHVFPLVSPWLTDI